MPRVMISPAFGVVDDRGRRRAVADDVADLTRSGTPRSPGRRRARVAARRRARPRGRPTSRRSSRSGRRGRGRRAPSARRRARTLVELAGGDPRPRVVNVRSVGVGGPLLGPGRGQAAPGQEVDRLRGDAGRQMACPRRDRGALGRRLPGPRRTPRRLDRWRALTTGSPPARSRSGCTSSPRCCSAVSS